MPRLDAVPEEVDTRQKLQAAVRVFQFKPWHTAAIAVLGLVAAMFEAIGLGFILPIVQITHKGMLPSGGGGRLFQAFLSVYQFIGVELTPTTAILGGALVIFVRYFASFLSAWTQARLQTHYRRYLQATAVDEALTARVAYFDREGADDIINAIVTQIDPASGVITQTISIFNKVVLAGMYLAIGLYLSSLLTVVLVGLLAGLVYLLVSLHQPAFELGDRVADANEHIQHSVQSSIQGIRDVKLFGMTDQMRGTFQDAIEQYVTASIKHQRNLAFLVNGYLFSAAIGMFVLIYAALTLTDLTFAELAIFLFAMLRLTPMVGQLIGAGYSLNGSLPHLVRTHAFIDTLRAEQEDTDGRPPPSDFEHIAFEDVSFAYDGGDPVLGDLSFGIDAGTFVGLVGPSGAGKSTVASLLAGLYEPDSGSVEVDGTPIGEFDLRAWRSNIAMVRQHAHIFNETLAYNLTVGQETVPRPELDRVCEIARVDAFLSDLPDGYETELGDDGVRLSGGQRQRVALARALLAGAPILLLDEATSELDSQLESEIFSAIEAAERDRTIVAIAHRLSAVAGADSIHVVEDGSIVESGTHGELVNRGRTYASLYATQQANP